MTIQLNYITTMERRLNVRAASRSPISTAIQSALVVVTFVVSGTMAVLCVMKLEKLFFDGESGSSVPADVFQAVLIVASLIATADWLKDQYEASEETRDQEHRYSNIGNVTINWLLVLIGVLAVLSAVEPVFEAVCVAACFSKKAGFQEFLRFVLGFLKVIYLASQVLFFILSRGGRCDTVKKSCWIMIFVTTNVCLIIRCMADGAQEAILYGHSESDWELMYGNKFCINQPAALRDGYMIVDKYFYSFIFLFGLYAVELLCAMWNMFPSDPIQLEDFSVATNCDPETSRADWDIVERDNTHGHTETSHLIPREPSRRTMLRRLKSAFCLKLCKYSMVLTILVCLALFITHAFLGTNIGDYDSVKDEPGQEVSGAYVWVQAIYENIVSGAAFMGYFLLRRETVKRDSVALRHILLVFSVCFFFMLITLEMVDSVANMVRLKIYKDIVLFLTRTFFHFLGAIFQTLLVLKSADLRQLSFTSDRFVYVRGILWFLAISNFERCVVDLFLAPVVLQHVVGVARDWVGPNHWTIITRVLMPGAIFYRLQSSLLFLENILKLKRRREHLGLDSLTV